MKTLPKALLQTFLVFVVLALGLVAAKGMATMRKPPETQAREVAAPLLRAQRVTSETVAMTVTGHGTVAPLMDVDVVPQVSGRVTQRHEQFVAGGHFAADTTLVVIDQRDYKITLQAAEAQVAQAEVNLAREEAEADVSRREWKKLHPDREPQSILVFREPQVNSAKAQRRAAQAQLERARLDLERTVITMPFAGRVVSVSADVGQFASQGQPIGTVYATDAVEISVPLEDAELAWIKVPGLNATDGTGAAATVQSTFAGVTHTWSGTVVRMKARVDAKSRMVDVVVRVLDPFDTTTGGPPLLPGLFARVAIVGETIDRLIAVPRFSLRNGREVWLAVEDRLEMRPVTVLRQDRRNAYISDGLADGDVVITSSLDTVTDGMKIRTLLETGN